ncbi:hypothetical protein PUP68_11785 [Pseudomonas chlororaphis]|uniref:hypothetical protein n=1 Tax=Pseudomonas chlororaphis TaxID=587753 RepID=UPI002367660C|nr:hypothetical protein [Pseudomonas chlororaphis]WDG79195.1 hypothetical protein PUP77_00455 [Pseudomonas chlororaphis]WDG87753.1 hypothetical protein PUP68_11785 [Pseudomonas chlororaphis]
MSITFEVGAELGGRVVVLSVAACQISGVGLAIPWGFGAVEFLAVAAPLKVGFDIFARRYDQVIGAVAALEQAAADAAFTRPVFADCWDARWCRGRLCGSAQPGQHLQCKGSVRSGQHGLAVTYGDHLHGMLL